MFTTKITYKDYFGKERTKEYTFNLSRAEVMDMNFDTDGGLEGLFKNMASDYDEGAFVKFFRTLIHKSYGKISQDGDSFNKSPEILKEFVESKAYDEFYTSLMTDWKKAVNFLADVLPEDYAQVVLDAAKEYESTVAAQNATPTLVQADAVVE